MVRSTHRERSLVRAKHTQEGETQALYVYCLFCETQKCRAVAYALEQRGIPRAFSPRIINRKRVKGKNLDVTYDLLPGYVFAYTEEKLDTFVAFRGIAGIIRWLGDQENGFELAGADYEFAMRLYRKDGLVGQLTVFKVGDEVRTDDPLFADCDGKITRIDYRKQRARVDYRFANVSYHVWVACDMITPAQKQEINQENGL